MQVNRQCRVAALHCLTGGGGCNIRIGRRAGSVQRVSAHGVVRPLYSYDSKDLGHRDQDMLYCQHCCCAHNEYACAKRMFGWLLRLLATHKRIRTLCVGENSMNECASDVKLLICVRLCCCC